MIDNYEQHNDDFLEGEHYRLSLIRDDKKGQIKVAGELFRLETSGSQDLVRIVEENPAFREKLLNQVKSAIIRAKHEGLPYYHNHAIITRKGTLPSE